MIVLTFMTTVFLIKKNVCIIKNKFSVKNIQLINILIILLNVESKILIIFFNS